MCTWIVDYQIATYSGTVELWLSEDLPEEEVIERAIRVLTQGAPLPFGYRSFDVRRAN